MKLRSLPDCPDKRRLRLKPATLGLRLSCGCADAGLLGRLARLLQERDALVQAVGELHQSATLLNPEGTLRSVRSGSPD